VSKKAKKITENIEIPKSVLEEPKVQSPASELTTQKPARNPKSKSPSSTEDEN
jgi:hypothetical protein